MTNYEKLQSILRELFEMDKADLDFGIYRIMNQKRKEVNEFIEKTLPNEIKSILSNTQSRDAVSLQAELDKMGKALDEAGVVRDEAPKYLALKEQIASATDVNALEQEIFSHLANFFKRYYKEGDFISQRRYKKDVYAIPYEGEEVKLHWANADQYYIKTSEYLKNYAFKIPGDKKVHFQLKEASTEQNNNKTQGDAERRFAIYAEQPIEENGTDLYINFTYEPHKKTVKQDSLAEEAIKIIQENIPAAFADAFAKAPTEKNKNRTLIEKHLNNFISRNSFDYFIHKDLGGFLNRELDFFIKNEVLYIDDIATEQPEFFVAQLSKIKAMKTVGRKIIAFLAQIEEFQKKLWLKKKMVIRTDYCITLDKISEKYYEEIFTNEAQIAEWKSLFNVQCLVMNGQLKVDDEESIPLSSLNMNHLPLSIKYLVLDTQFFSDEFKDRLLGEFDNLDEETDGVLINSENFQALNLLQEKYEGQILGIYIDPPYNTNASEIIYKNNYRSSSWLSFMENRLKLGLNLMTEEGMQCTTIDEIEFHKLRELINLTFQEENVLGVVTIKNNPSGRSTVKGFSIAHEYAIFSSKSDSSSIGMIPRTKEQLKQYDNKDAIGQFQWRSFLRSGGANDTRKARPKLHYPIAVRNKEIYLPNLSWDNEANKWKITEEIDDDWEIIYPISNDLEYTWRLGVETLQKRLKDLRTRTNNNGKRVFDIKFYIDVDGVLPKTIWDDKNVNATAYGTTLLRHIMGENHVFSFPKSVFAVEQSLKVLSGNKDNFIILDYFAGSGTTGHATIKLNREDGGKRKYILVEMGTYFDTVTKPRIQKVIYSDNWKNGKPQDKDGISQLFKYQVLESYEDVLNNLKLAESKKELFEEHAQEEYLLNYMLDIESRDHLFDIEIFKNPFDYKLKVTENNELIPTQVDLVETFNYLIGLYVERIQRVKDIKLVEGKTRTGEKTLIIWRNTATTKDEEVQTVFRKLYDSVRSQEFDQIYINGDHHFKNFRVAPERFKVKMIEQEFFKLMFND